VKTKYVEERFNGPWHDLMTKNEIVCSSDGPLENKEIIEAYNTLLQFAAEMAVEFAEAAPEPFRKFYYQKEK
jgi:hypothetical protein